MEETVITPRRRSLRHPAGRIARVDNPPRPGSQRDGARASDRPGQPKRPAEKDDRAKDDWMKPLDDDDRRALEAAWGFVE